ncbi:MAG: hypothetical protein IJX78_02055 [Bacilli bacterium]|nr:hypothetical protein [Bacilli bacterium]
MRNIHDPNEYHKYKSVTGNNNSKGTYVSGLSGGCKIIIGIGIVMLISFLFDGASWEAIEGLLSFGLIAFVFVKWITS